jgi:hypothetical protein
LRKIIRRVSDLFRAGHGLPVIENPKPSHGSYGTWLRDKKELPFQDKTRTTIDAAPAQKPPDFHAFLALMKVTGFTVKSGKRVKLTGPGQQRGTRLNILKGDYTEQAKRKKICADLSRRGSTCGRF